MTIPRPEYPRPQFVRADWRNLNGEWEFEIDFGDSGAQRGLTHRPLNDRIQVPFCPESPLSGIGYTDFMLAVWYRKVVRIPSEWAGKRILLHFGAIDYDATVWVNGEEAARHRGGFTPFTCVLDNLSAGEEATIVVRARDDWRHPQARGKQSQRYAPHGCHYTRTTGIWQTVWMEPVEKTHLHRPRITPDLAAWAFHLQLPLSGNADGLRAYAEASTKGEVLCSAEIAADLDLSPHLTLTLPPDKIRPWSIEDPFLYDLKIQLRDGSGKTMDEFVSYAGLRSLSIHGQAIRMNGKPVFQRLVLDQGYYPDGVMTAPSDEALIADIALSQEAGFNGARLHQKVFEERFLYHADRMGYLLWGEFGDWGCRGGKDEDNSIHMDAAYVRSWLEAVERDYSHPSIVGWCPLNETAQKMRDEITELDDATHAMYLATKAMDGSRPVLDASGYSHRIPYADVYDSHDYISETDWETGLENFKNRHARMDQGEVFINPEDGKDTWSVPYQGQPYFISEFGGFKWVPEDQQADARSSWGYGGAPQSLEDFYRRFAAKCDLLLDNPHMFGYCYTQLTDIYPELNGIYAFDRAKKFDSARLKAIQSRRAAIEESRESVLKRQQEIYRRTPPVSANSEPTFPERGGEEKWGSLQCTVGGKEAASSVTR